MNSTVSLILSLLVILGLADVGGAASTDRTVLYGLSGTGVLYSINTTTGVLTTVRQLPYPITMGGAEQYQNLAVYQGAFITVTSTGTLAFGLDPQDMIRLASTARLTDLTEYPSTGLPGGWANNAQLTGYAIHEISPFKNSDSTVVSSTVSPTLWFGTYYCDPVGALLSSTFFGNTKGYFLMLCNQTNGYSAAHVAMIRAELQSGTWVKTFDAEVAVPNNTPSLAADPNNDGTVYLGTGNGISRMSISGSTVTVTGIGTGGTGAFLNGLAFGPPAADVLSPSDVPSLQPFANRPWTPIQMLLSQ